MTIIYNYHLNEAKSPDLSLNFLQYCQQYECEFLSENCFVIKNEEGRYLTAFDDNETVKFHAKNIGRWEKFFIFDEEIQKFIETAINEKFQDDLGSFIQDYKLFIDDTKLKVLLGKTVVTPSFIPRAKLDISSNYCTYETLLNKTKMARKRTLVYFCIYGKDEYYDLFGLAIKSLIESGKYTGDILVKSDDFEKVETYTKHFSNRILHSKIKDEIAMSNKYLLEEEFLDNYDSIIYMDSDILTINDVNKFFMDISIKGDFAACNEANSDLFKKLLESRTYIDSAKWWGVDFLKNIDGVKKYYGLNAGFFVINNLEKVKPIFNRVIDYYPFETKCLEQPSLNIALQNSNIEIYEIPRTAEILLTKQVNEGYKNLDKVMIHFHSGVGNSNKLELMQNIYNCITVP